LLGAGVLEIGRFLKRVNDVVAIDRINRNRAGHFFLRFLLTDVAFESLASRIRGIWPHSLARGEIEYWRPFFPRRTGKNRRNVRSKG
jgi:hypothetical protein